MARNQGASASASASGGTGSNDVTHIHGGARDLPGRLRGKPSRALCGELLTGDPDGPDPDPGTPACERCAELAGRQ